MHKEILSPAQIELLDFIQSFSGEYYLVGRTAIALQIGHRRSIDFDLFRLKPIRPSRIRARIKDFDLSFELIFEDAESFHISVGEVKITFLEYPFHIPLRVKFGSIRMPDLLNLAAMKAYALGRRARWKDYVDLYYVLQNHATIHEVADQAEVLFGSMFSKKLLLLQLCYFEDIDFSEQVEYLSQGPTEKLIQDQLCRLATENFS